MGSSTGGWIKLQRKIIDHWIWQDADKLKAWIHLLLMANHEEKKLLSKGELLHLMPGQFVTSKRKLAEKFGWSENRVSRFLSLLESDGMIEKKCTALGTTITIVNYGLYQNGQPTYRPTNEPTDGTIHETTNEPTDGTLTRIYKNDKECKEGEEAPPAIPVRHETQEEADAVMARWREQMKERSSRR